ncbi:MAG: helix-turn-helix domain-containing protein [Clostridia bacterium]|nr:helix-turn-helix domain-containing protein [Clostridia bacterium]
MRLLELREEKKLTQDDVAKAINTSRTNIGRWEKGLNEPSSSLIIQLADFFQCSTDYLLGRSDDFGNVIVTPTQKTAELSPDGQELLDIFNSLDVEYKSQILEYAHFIHERATFQKKNKF